MCLFHSLLDRVVCYPVVRQLQANLEESVGADAQSLDPSFPKLSEGENVAVHILCQRLGHSEGAVDLSLDLREKTMERSHKGSRCQEERQHQKETCWNKG